MGLLPTTGNPIPIVERIGYPFAHIFTGKILFLFQGTLFSFQGTLFITVILFSLQDLSCYLF